MNLAGPSSPTGLRPSSPHPLLRSSARPYNDEMYRLSTFADAMEGLDGTILARCGFFYDSRYRIVECFSCHVRHRFINRVDISLYCHLPSCAFAKGQPTRNIPRQISNSQVSLSAQIERESIYGCLDPRHPGMRFLEDRVQSFSNGWSSTHIRCTVRDLAEAGYFYVGPNDRTQCFYCGGTLRNWEINDDPWEEHAKWLPSCEFLLRIKGPEYAQRFLFANLETSSQSRTTDQTTARYSFATMSNAVQRPPPLASANDEVRQNPDRVTLRRAPSSRGGAANEYTICGRAGDRWQNEMHIGHGVQRPEISNPSSERSTRAQPRSTGEGRSSIYLAVQRRLVEMGFALVSIQAAINRRRNLRVSGDFESFASQIVEDLILAAEQQQTETMQPREHSRHDNTGPSNADTNSFLERNRATHPPHSSGQYTESVNRSLEGRPRELVPAGLYSQSSNADTRVILNNCERNRGRMFTHAMGFMAQELLSHVPAHARNAAIRSLNRIRLYGERHIFRNPNVTSQRPRQISRFPAQNRNNARGLEERHRAFVSDMNPGPNQEENGQVINDIVNMIVRHVEESQRATYAPESDMQ